MAIQATTFHTYQAYGGVCFERVREDGTSVSQVLISADEWKRFIAAVKDGKLDNILTDEWQGYDVEVLALLGAG